MTGNRRAEIWISKPASIPTSDAVKITSDTRNGSVSLFQRIAQAFKSVFTSDGFLSAIAHLDVKCTGNDGDGGRERNEESNDQYPSGFWRVSHSTVAPPLRV
jgi:hypothetical protein